MMTYVVECSSDERLLLLMGAPRRSVVHEGNRDEVVKFILKKEAGKFIGMIDEDPGTIHGNQRRQFQDGPAQHDHYVASFQDKKLVLLQPMLEGWLVKAVKSVGGSMSAIDKGLSDDPRELHRTLAPRGDTRLKKVIDFLKEKDSPHLRALRRTLGL